jgi:hypothetical protein
VKDEFGIGAHAEKWLRLKIGRRGNRFNPFRVD